MKYLKKLGVSIGLFALALGFVPAGVASAYDGAATGQGDVNIFFLNREGQSHPAPPAINPGAVPSYNQPPLLPLLTRMLLSDANSVGDFEMQFDIYERNQPVFDSFRVTNTGNLPLAFTLISEEQTLVPASTPDFNDLLVCFNQLCDLNTYAPDTLFVKPVPLGVVLPGQSQVFTVGIKLAAGADWNEWDGLGMFSTLHFQALPTL